MAQTLGTLSSGSVTTGKQSFFVSLDKRLATGDTVTGTPVLDTESTGITLTAPLVSTAVLSSNDGTIVAPIGRAITFTVETGKDVKGGETVTIEIAYATTNGWSETIAVDLSIATVVKVT
jgi:hypothetical protein